MDSPHPFLSPLSFSFFLFFKEKEKEKGAEPENGQVEKRGQSVENGSDSVEIFGKLWMVISHKSMT
ncbi:hypothetical protein [Pseudogulbenkiania sp. MAI-1]|uniref:hypothetical protein n=1 Tax=Pseudogulbenkiania sp. MAI-1 TaxID=990370 RepID=UPI0018DE2101|nr:hypothetical protein [Pseudogulbenkiania sp. MAI-1]